jgi:hypothetical protein
MRMSEANHAGTKFNGVLWSCDTAYRSPFRLETVAAEYRTTLRRQERNGRLRPALRAGRARLRTHAGGAGSTFGLARLTSLRVIAELLLVEKQLLSRGKNKFPATIDTLQDFIGKFHFHVLPSLVSLKRE